MVAAFVSLVEVSLSNSKFQSSYLIVVVVADYFVNYPYVAKCIDCCALNWQSSGAFYAVSRYASATAPSPSILS